MKQILSAQKKKINNSICGTSPGIFSDEYWNGVKRVWDALDNVCKRDGLVWAIEGSKYDTDDNGSLCRKTWQFSVSDGQRQSIGVVVAAGAGSVSDPLSKYDVVSYI